ncbi:ABC transporter ATP-binding protein [Paracoccus versutus]|uniref:Branched-chain amino acid transport system ATP-binding protein n=1 Tax=Paracoccus versutus TaxID=34007 RepID=A0A3D9XWB3_PARVE|nr:ABC transporter ATP-binding protein [Paracoccus versutus]REF73423.1 branched-chain amino acid transport system ATP-binding protein [Paracoccus versutus]
MLDQYVGSVETGSAHARTDAMTMGCSGLGVMFDGLAAISDVTLSLRRDEILGLIGPNGAGKTTLVNCLTGFQRPTTGSVTLGGENTLGWSVTKFREMGIARTFQAGRLFRDMSVIENVEVTGVGLGLSRRIAHDKAAAMLNWLGLSDMAWSKAGSLAYTDQRRLSIARALVVPPAFILLDEPAAGMSDTECEALNEVIVAIPQNFTCGVLLIEHNMRVVMSISDRIHVLDGGKTIGSGTPEEIKANAAVVAAYLGEA